MPKIGEKGMNIRKLPFTNLVRRPARTAALILLTALLALSVFGGSMVVMSLRSGLKSLESRLGADIIVVPSSAQSKVSFKNMLLQGTTGAFYMSSDNLDRTLEVEGVEKAAPQIFLSSLKADCCSIRIQVIGIDPETDFIVQPWMEESCSQTLGDMDVVVGCNVGTDVGETLKIYDQHCHVTGKLASTGTGLDSAVYCNMDTMKKLLEAAEEKGITHDITSEDDGVVSAIYVTVKEGYDIGKVNSAIQGHTRKASAVRTKSMITDVSGSLSGISRTAVWLIAMVWILSFVILLVAFFMIANERKREFALLRLLGTSRKKLGGVIRKETVICSLLGGILGIAVSAVFLFSFTRLIEKNLGLPYLTPALYTICLTALLTLAGTVLIGLAASAWATFRLSRVDPGAVLRGN